MMGTGRQKTHCLLDDGETAARNVQLRFETIKRAAKIGFSEYHPGSGQIFWDERLREWWGLSEDEPVTLDLFLSGLHPHDREPTLARLANSLDPRGSGEYFAEYRVISRRDGMQRWVASNGQVVFENGEPQRLIGAIIDITQRKQAESALRESEQLLSLALDAAEMGVWSSSPATGEATANAQARYLLALPAHLPLNDAALAAAVHPEDRAKIGVVVQRSKSQGTLFDLRFRVLKPDGTVRWVSARGRWCPEAPGMPGRTIGVLMDGTSQVQQLKTLRAARAEAERAVRARSQFFAAASHDLRQPFQAMRLFFELLAQSPRDDQRSAFERLGQAMRSAEELLDHFLDVARLESGSIAPEPTNVDIMRIIREVKTDLEPMAVRKGLSLKARGVAGVVTVDPVLLKRVLFNLVNNAIKYTETGGVLIGVRRRPQRLIVEVWDTGIGIGQDEAEWIFDDFFQAHNPGRDRTKGVGLGLAIVKRLCNLIGCAVTFASRPAKGSVFRLDIPVTLISP